MDLLQTDKEIQEYQEKNMYPLLVVICFVLILISCAILLIVLYDKEKSLELACQKFYSTNQDYSIGGIFEVNGICYPSKNGTVEKKLLIKKNEVWEPYD